MGSYRARDSERAAIARAVETAPCPQAGDGCPCSNLEYGFEDTVNRRHIDHIFTLGCSPPPHLN